MRTADALKLIEGVSYKPGWRVLAVENDQYEDCVTVRIVFPVPNSNPEYAPQYTEPVDPIPQMDFNLLVGDCNSELSFYGKLLECFLQVERHEVREFFGVGGKYDKPFHPHTIEGMRNWASRRPVIEAEDYTLGIMAHA